eukprot:8004497-Prorocentrum_lima.AAC.1
MCIAWLYNARARAVSARMPARPHAWATAPACALPYYLLLPILALSVRRPWRGWAGQTMTRSAASPLRRHVTHSPQGAKAPTDR